MVLLHRLAHRLIYSVNECELPNPPRVQAFLVFDNERPGSQRDFAFKGEEAGCVDLCLCRPEV